METATGIKTFVLDTNVLLHSAGCIGCFKEHDVVIPMAVVEELDKFKKNNDELGRNARMVIRKLDRLRQSEPVPSVRSALLYASDCHDSTPFLFTHCRHT